MDDGMRPSGTGVMGSCEHSRDHWDSNSGPLQGQQGLLATEPSLGPLRHESYRRHGSKSPGDWAQGQWQGAAISWID